MIENKDILDLLPCPFCGSIDLRIKKCPMFNDDFTDYKLVDSRVECLNCGADGPMIAFVNDVKSGWNKRKSNGN